MDERTIALFWSRVYCPYFADCWVWTGAYHSTGYGWFQRQRAHRIAWELTEGPIPKGLVVMHRCDNPFCVNPAHLALGSLSSNSYDMIAKGRHTSQLKRRKAASLNLAVRQEIIRRLAGGVGPSP